MSVVSRDAVCKEDHRLPWASSEKRAVVSLGFDRKPRVKGSERLLDDPSFAFRLWVSAESTVKLALSTLDTSARTSAVVVIGAVVCHCAGTVEVASG